MNDPEVNNTIALIDELIRYIKEQAQLFGAKQDATDKKDYIFRNNTRQDALDEDKAPYFGLISPDEELSGQYHDLSLVIFPGSNYNDQWLVALGIGTLGFKNDYELAVVPGLRRSFASIIDPRRGFIKSSLLDMDSKLPKEFVQKIPEISKTIATYGKLLPACEIIDPKTNEGKIKISAFLAIYSSMRQWASNNNQKEQIRRAIDKCAKQSVVNEEDDVYTLIKRRKYVVLQGAPGTGKTRLAQIIADKIGGKEYFTQFHAETSYSDFIFGIRPDVEKDTLHYEYKKGIFFQALEYSLNNPAESTTLIIDEINRANLANVLGPILYLFEYDSDRHDIPVLIGGDFRITKIPDNFFVIATMNTADRSLAMVDFALRRRFAWYTLYPHEIIGELSGGRKFFKSEFDALDQIFKWYAKNEELVFQPGHSYFIAKDDVDMKNRLRYEIYPLINEYLAEGNLLNAKEDLIQYFRERLGGEIAL